LPVYLIHDLIALRPGEQTMPNEIMTQSPAPQKPKRRSKSKPGIPYEGATSGEGARTEATKILRRLSCEQIEFMDATNFFAKKIQFLIRSLSVTIPKGGKVGAVAPHAWLL
jgi:hypothetical protein